jgi:hypothetical protein
MMNFTDIGKQVDRYWENFETRMRDNPETVLLGAVAAGFLLQVLPIRALVLLVLRVTLFLLKPALIFWVGFKVYRWTQAQSREPKEEASVKQR